MNIDLKERIRGKLAIITPNRGISFDWGLVTNFNESILLKNDDNLSILHDFGGDTISLTIKFLENPVLILGYTFSRTLDVPDRILVEHLFTESRRVILTRNVVTR